jgi:Mn2+/Fe2+ NRAMP family transporter
LDPMKALFVAAVINGMVAAPVLVFMMLLGQNAKVMGDFPLPRYLRVTGWITAVIMMLASVGMLFTLHS